ncbi:MAG TPA: type III-A CRISPR-associated protein Csm2 [Candidatus Hydrogenedentes bacterium]|mgnify:CR=1 FL=1|nr:type III-A CRISPR-associated protein Csm2 [Candidatus Hydrogenedentota bacterium]
MTTLATAVEKGIDNDFITSAEKFGSDIARTVTTSQIRNIFGSVKKMEMEAEMNLSKVLLLKPRIAYASARNKGLGDLARQLTDAIDMIDKGKSPAEKNERFHRFCQGFEAILAYHRAHGGK